MTDINTETASIQNPDITVFDPGQLPEYAPLVAVKAYRPDFVVGLTDEAAVVEIRSRLDDLSGGLTNRNVFSRLKAFYERLGLTRENLPAFVVRFGRGLMAEVESTALQIADMALARILESGIDGDELTELDVMRFLAPLVQHQDANGRWHSLPQGLLRNEYRKPRCSGFAGYRDMTDAERILYALRQDLTEAMTGEGARPFGKEYLRFRGSCFDVGPESSLPFEFTLDKKIEITEQGRSHRRLTVNLFSENARDYHVRWKQVAGDVALTINEDGQSAEISALEDITEDQKAIVGVTVSDGKLEAYREVSVLVRDLGMPNSPPEVAIEAPEMLDGGETLVAKLVGMDSDPLDGSALRYSWSVESQYGSIEPIVGEGMEIQIPTPNFLRSGSNHDNLLIRARVDDGHEENHIGEAIAKVMVLGTEPAPPEEKTTVAQTPGSTIFGPKPKPYLTRKDDLFLIDASASMQGLDRIVEQKIRAHLEAEYAKVKEGGLCRIRVGWYVDKNTEILFDSGWFDGLDLEVRQRVFESSFSVARSIIHGAIGGYETLWYSLWDLTIGRQKLDFARGPAEKATVIPVCDSGLHDFGNEVRVPGRGLFTSEKALDLIWDEGIEVKFLEVP